MKAWATPVSADRGAKAIFWLLLIVSLLPVSWVSIPAMVDYPNHLARMFILSRHGTPDANPFYQVAWALYPNLAMDLIVPRLARLMSVESATRVFYLLSQLLIVTGAMAIEWVVKGRFQLSGIIAIMFLYSLPFSWGFMNFEFGLGIALWGIAGFRRLQERPWPLRLGVHSAFVAVLFFAHFFALGLYGVVLGLHELWRAWIRKAPVAEVGLRFVLLALPAAALLGLMGFFGGAIGGEGTKWFLLFKPLWLVHILNGYSLLLAGSSMAALVFLLHVSARRGVLRIEPEGLWLAAGFALLYLAIPSKLFDTSFVDLRVLVAAALVLPAFISLSFPSRAWRVAMVSCAIAITLANLALVLSIWISYRADYATMIESFGKIKKGSLVLVGHSGDGADPPLRRLEDYPIYHGPTLAAHYANAFVPSLYAVPGKQPITAHPPFPHLAVRYSGPVPVALLKAIADNKASPDTVPAIRSWHRDFDYLYLVGPRIPNPMPGLLEELDAAPRFVLYRIRKESSP